MIELQYKDRVVFHYVMSDRAAFAFLAVSTLALIALAVTFGYRLAQVL